MRRVEEEGKSKEEKIMTTGSSCSSNGLLPSSASPRKTDDLEVGQPIKEFELDDDESDPFDIAHTKNVSPEILRRWRQAALVLNASRRFRYTLDLKKVEEKEQSRRMIRSHAHVIRAALLFRLRGEQQIARPPTATSDYAIGLEELASMTRDHNIYSLQQCGNVKGLSKMLKTNLATGIVGDENDLIKRMNTFGTNRYPQKKGRNFLRFLWEAWQDLTLIILIVAAITSLGLGIKTEGLSHGWYDGASISFAVMLVIIVTVSKFK